MNEPSSSQKSQLLELSLALVLHLSLTSKAYKSLSSRARWVVLVLIVKFRIDENELPSVSNLSKQLKLDRKSLGRLLEELYQHNILIRQFRGRAYCYSFSDQPIREEYQFNKIEKRAYSSTTQYQPYFRCLMHHLLCATDKINPTTKLVLFSLLYHADHCGLVSIQTSVLVIETNLTKQTVYAALKQLRKWGLIRVSVDAVSYRQSIFLENKATHVLNLSHQYWANNALFGCFYILHYTHSAPCEAFELGRALYETDYTYANFFKNMEGSSISMYGAYPKNYRTHTNTASSLDVPLEQSQQKFIEQICSQVLPMSVKQNPEQRQQGLMQLLLMAQTKLELHAGQGIKEYHEFPNLFTPRSDEQEIIAYEAFQIKKLLNLNTMLPQGLFDLVESIYERIFQNLFIEFKENFSKDLFNPPSIIFPQNSPQRSFRVLYVRTEKNECDMVSIGVVTENGRIEFQERHPLTPEIESKDLLRAVTPSEWPVYPV